MNITIRFGEDEKNTFLEVESFEIKCDGRIYINSRYCTNSSDVSVIEITFSKQE